MATTARAVQAESVTATAPKVRQAVFGEEPAVLADIYKQQNNIVVWQRTLPKTLRHSVATLLRTQSDFQTSMTVSPDSVLASLGETLGDDYADITSNIAELVDMFCDLFELQRVGLRLTALDSAMCPKFHADKVPCRLVTTFQGIATEWLPHHAVNRAKLGAGSLGVPDSQSGLYASPTDIQQLKSGDVALLKGENWEGNENAGLVHRSPMVSAGARRLLCTLDFSH